MAVAYSKRASLSPVPDVSEVAWQATRNDEDGVDPNDVVGAGVTEGKLLGSNRHPAEPIFVERPSCCVGAAALLYFDKCYGPAATSDEVNFAARNASSIRKNVPAFDAEPPSSNCFCPAPPCFGLLAG